MPESSDLIVGGARNVGGRCIIPIIRMFAIYREESAMASLAPVALIIIEGESEYFILLPGAPRSVEDALGELRGDIEHQKERCAG